VNFAELINSIIQASKERLKNPFVGSYCLVFLFWNWQPIVYLLLSDSAIHDRIDYIVVNYTSFPHTVLIPILIAFIYNILPPYIMLVVDKLTSEGKLMRLKHSNIDREQEIDYKMKLVDKEIMLREAQSTERTLESLMKKITLVEEEKANLQLKLNQEISNLTTVTQSLNDLQIKNTNLISEVSNLQARLKDVSIDDAFTTFSIFDSAFREAVQNGLDLKVISKLSTVNTSLHKISSNNLRSFLIRYGFAKNSGNHLVFTELGANFVKYLNTNVEL